MLRKTRSVSQYQKIEDSKIKGFLDAQSDRTRKTYLCTFRKVLEFTSGQSGSEMLRDSKLWSQKILALNQWLIGQGYSENYIQNVTGMIRGYFGFYRKPLDLRRSDTRKLNRKARRNEDYVFTREAIKSMVDSGSQREKYVLLAGISFGLRSEDFVKVTFGRLRLAMKDKTVLDCPISAGTLNTRKENVTSHLFISSDLFPIAKSILDSNASAKDEDPVFNERPVQLTTILQILALKSGVDPHDTHIRFHGLRAFLFTQLSSVGSEQIAKMVLGKKLPGGDAPYLKADLQETYKRAEARICVSTGNGDLLKKRVSSLESENQDLKKKLEFYENLMKNFKKGYDKESAVDSIGITGTRLETVQPPEPSLDSNELRALRSFAKALVDTRRDE